MNVPDTLPEIVQIIPASGYLALYRGVGDAVLSSRVVMWAIVRHTERGDTYNDVEGLESAEEDGICRCEEASNFLAYVEASTFRAEEWTLAARGSTS